jgi:cytoskeleton-associated protein 5
MPPYATWLQARFKSSKFEIRPEELQSLEAELGALAAPSLRANLFAKDFQKQVCETAAAPWCCMV